jgi:hypothetical protein
MEGHEEFGAETDVEIAALAVADFKISHIEGNGCNKVRVDYTTAPSVTGKSMLRYEFERRRKTGSTYASWATVATASAAKRDMADYHFLANEAYQYRVRPYYTANGVVSKGSPTASESLTVDCSVPRAVSGTTQPIEVYLFTPSGTEPPAKLTKSYVNKLIFAESNENSVFNFLQDVSAGAFHTDAIPQVRISGTVHAWQQLSKPMSGYPNGLGDMADEKRALFDSLHAANPDTLYVFIFNTGSGGGESGGQYVRVGAQELIPDVGIGIGAVVHEIGHSIGLKHELAVESCPDGVFPEALEDIDALCHIYTYSSAQNTMSMASTYPNYFSGVQKRRLGFLGQQNVTWLDIRDQAVGTSKEYELMTSTTAQASTAQQLIMLKFDDADTSYALQYRHAAGFDTYTSRTRLIGTAEPFPAGVFVYLVPGRSLAGLDGCEAALLHRGSASPLVVTTSGNTMFYDPYRKVEVSVTKMTNSAATVIVKRR